MNNTKMTTELDSVTTKERIEWDTDYPVAFRKVEKNYKVLSDLALEYWEINPDLGLTINTGVGVWELNKSSRADIIKETRKETLFELGRWVRGVNFQGGDINRDMFTAELDRLQTLIDEK